MRILTYIKRGVNYMFRGLPENIINANVSLLSPNDMLCGRTAFITGGTSGIGFEIAKSFLSSGANVIITGRSEEKLCVAIEKLQSNFPKNIIYGAIIDNRRVSSFQNEVDKVIDKVGKIDILVNNAGVLGGEIMDATEDEFDTIIDTNLKGVFFLSQLFGKYFKINHIEGNILNIASSSSLRPASSVYTVSKWGIRGLTLGLAKSFAPYGITVNGLAPGPTATPMLNKKENDNIAFERNPIGRYALPQEIANMAVILVSNMGRTIVGDVVYMTGGAGLLTFDDVDYRF